MRTVLAFVLGAALVSATWVFAGPSRSGNVEMLPAPDGPAALDGLGEPVPDFGWVGPGGEAASLSDLLGEGPLVVAIRDLNCPVSQKYGVNLRELEGTFLPRGVRFLYADLTPSSVRWNVGMARDQAQLSGTTVRHLDEEFFTALQPRTTTEVFLIDGSGVLRYRGAIDDQFGISFARQAPRERFLEDALEAVLDGEDPPRASTFAPGYFLQQYLEARPPAEPTSPPAVTYAGTIRTLIDENCTSCHSPGGGGPFTLEGYDAVVAHGEEIRAMVSQERMPPWPANPGYGSWANDARLNAREKADFLEWFAAGMPLGESGSPPDEARVTGSAAGEWRHGTPDAVFSVADPGTVRDGQGLPLQTFYISTDFPEDRWVSGVEILPSAPESVVQAVVLLEAPDVAPAEQSFGLEGFFAGYAPGYDGGAFPAGTAKRLPAGAWLKVQLHYPPQEAPTEDRTRVGLTFSDGPPAAEIETRSAYATGFEIPSHAAHHAVTAEYRFEEGGEIRAFSPQMHLRGSAIRYVLVDPRGEERVLLDVPRYYFQFRLRYVASEPIEVEPGSVLRVTGWYDNSEANLTNPDPSATASFGANLTDELMIGYFDFVPHEAPRASAADGEVEGPDR